LGIKICIKVPEEKQIIFRTNLASINFNYYFLTIEEVQGENGSWIIKNTKNLGNFSELDILKALKTTISFLLTNITEPEQTIIEPTEKIVEKEIVEEVQQLQVQIQMQEQEVQKENTDHEIRKV